MNISLEKYNQEQILSGIYHTIKLLSHRDTVASTESFINNMRATSIEKQLVKSLVESVERNAKVKIDDLSEIKANYYILELAKLVEENSFRTFGHNKKKGQELLKKLRQEAQNDWYWKKESFF